MTRMLCMLTTFDGGECSELSLVDERASDVKKEEGVRRQPDKNGKLTNRKVTELGYGCGL
jgi:hypothetical protein